MFNVQLKDALAVFKNLPQPEEALQGNSLEVLGKLKPEEALISDSVTKALKPAESKSVLPAPQKNKSIKR